MNKQRLFQSMNQMYNYQIITPVIYYILIFIEFLQLLYYSINQSYLFKNGIFSYFKYIVQYFQTAYFINGATQSLQLTFLIIGFTITLATFILLIPILFAQKSLIQSYSLKTFNFMMVLMITILILPIFSVYLSSLSCSYVDCFSQIFIAYIILSIVGILLQAILVVFFEIFLIDFNPFSGNIDSSRYQKLNWIELGFKVLLPIYTIADQSQNAQTAFVGILTIFYLALLIFRLKTRQFIDNRVNILKICQTGLLFWFSFVAAAHGLLNQNPIDEMGFFYEIFCSPLVVYCCFKLTKSPQLDPHIRTEVELEETVQELIHLIEYRNRTEIRLKLEGFVKLHIKSCMKSLDNCPCSILHQDNLRADDSLPEKNQRWFSFVQSIIQNSPERLLTTRIQIIRAHILQQKLKNRFKAYYELASAMKNRVSFQEEFCIFRVQAQIESEMIDQDKNEDIDVQQIVNFQNLYIKFEALIEQSVNLHLDYWRELQEETPDIGKLQQLGTHITMSIDDSEILYDQLLEISSNHLKTLEIFGNFLFHVVNNDIEGQRILEKAEQIAKNLEVNKFFQNDKFKYDQNSNTTIVTCSINSLNLGHITNCNNEVSKLLGYKKQEIIKSNINRIMPKVLAQAHDDFIKNFVQTSQSKVLGIERQVFAQNKAGLLVSCSLMIRVLPNLSEGLRIVGFLKGTENSEAHYYIMFDENTHQILGFSKQVHDNFGIPLNVIQGYVELPITEITQGLLENISKNQVFKFIFDSTNLESNYQFVQDLSLDDLNVQEDPSQLLAPKESNYLIDNNLSYIEQSITQKREVNVVSNNRFKKAHMKGIIIEDQEYGTCKIKTIQFIEDVDDVPMKTVREQQLEHQQQQQEEIKFQIEQAKEQDVIQSEISGASASVNEEVRQIKEFKIQMGEKSEAKNVVMLNRVVIVLAISLIILASVQLGYRIQQNGQILDGQYTINTVYFRTSVLADVIFYTRMLNSMATDLTPYNQTIRDTLFLQANQLKDLQYSIIKYEIQMSSLNTLADDGQVKMYTLSANNTVSYNSEFNDAVFQVQGSASLVCNASLDSFVLTNSTQNTRTNVFIIIQNGYQAIRERAETVSQTYNNFYLNQINSYQTIYIVILTLAVLALVFAQFGLIPIVLKIHDINSNVMSLFGLLQPKDIKELADRCEQFKVDFFLLYDQQQYVDENIKKKKIEPIKANIIEINNEDVKIVTNNNISVINTPMPAKTSQPMIEAHEEIQQDYQQIRQQKLLNSKSSVKFAVTIKFLFIMGVFMAYFIINLVLEQQQIYDTQALYDVFLFFKFFIKHEKYVSQRPYFVKFSLYFAVEQMLGQFNLKDSYIQRLYTNERNVTISLQNDFPSQFQQYIDTYVNFNIETMCLSFTTSQFTNQQAACKKLLGGILDKGISNAITTLGLWVQQSQIGKQYLSSSELQDYISLVYYIDQATVYLNNIFLKATYDYTNYQQQVENVKYSIFIIFLFAVYIFIWRPYNNGLSKQIWRTKGMLNMIPFEMIKQQASLKNAFLKGNIIQAVK